jgi:DNA-binding transcriptional regulator YiaG
MSQGNATLMPISDSEKKQIMRALRESGVSDSVIGQAFGVSKQAVHGSLGARDPAIPTLVQPKVKIRPDMPALTDDADKLLPGALYEWRQRRNLSQTEASPIIGVVRNVWSSWERGGRTCSLPVVVLRLLDALDKLDGIEK